jgi:hypothetical protein
MLAPLDRNTPLRGGTFGFTGKCKIRRGTAYSKIRTMIPYHLRPTENVRSNIREIDPEDVSFQYLRSTDIWGLPVLSVQKL